MENLLTIEDLKELFHIGNTKVYKLCEQPSFPSFRLNKVWYVDQDELVKWMQKVRKMPDKTYTISIAAGYEFSAIPEDERKIICEILGWNKND